MPAFHKYEEIRKMIKNQSFDQEHLEDLRKIVVSEEEFMIFEKKVSRINRAGELDKEKIYSSMYRDFITLKSNPDVIYGYIQERSAQITDKIDIILNKQIDARSKFRPPSWAWMILGEMAIVAYQCTTDERFLKFVIDIFDKIMLCRDDALGFVDQIRNQCIPSWGSKVSVNGSIKHFNEITVAGITLLPVMKLCSIVVSNDQLKKKYGQKVNFYISEAIKILECFYSDIEIMNTGATVRSPIDNLLEPFNHYHPYASCFIYLYHLTKDEAYLKRFEMFCSFFKSSLVKENNGSYSWAYRPTPESDLLSNRPEQLWKARTTILLPLIAYEHNICFNDDDITAFTKTFTENIHIRGTRFNIFISNRKRRVLDRAKIRTVERQARVQTLAAWLMLSRYNVEIKDIIDLAVAKRRDLFPDGWFGYTTSALGYAYRLAT